MYTAKLEDGLLLITYQPLGSKHLAIFFTVLTAYLPVQELPDIGYFCPFKRLRELLLLLRILKK